MNLLKNGLFVAICVMMIIIPLADAQNNSPGSIAMNHLNIHLENKNVTNVIAYDETSKANLSDFNIQKPEELWIPSSVNKFDAVTFDHTSFNEQLKSEKGIVISIGEKDYQTELSRMKFENNTDGVYSYYGTLVGVKNSSMLFTTRKNVIFGTITAENETFWIIPVEPRARTEIAQSPLHIIYSSKDVKNETFIFDKQPDTIKGVVDSAISQNLISNLQLTPPDQWVFVDILVVTDSEFYSTSDWLGSAYDIINKANLVLERDNIKVHLIGHYDASRRNQFSASQDKTSDPLGLLMSVYTTADLDSYSPSWPPDIALYLGGNDYSGDAQGMSLGFTNPPDACRYAWAQMVPDDYWYSGSPQGRASVSLHEIGHIFDATHEDITRPPNEPQYTHATWYLDGLSYHQTVMWHSYFEQANTMEFSSYSSPYCGSSVVCHGDSTHDNARRISETRDTVAMYAHKDKIGVFRPSNGKWYLNYNYADVTHKTIPLGTTGDIPVIGDYNGDGLTDAAVFRPTTGYWYFDYNLDGISDKSFRYGSGIAPYYDLPIKGDWNGDGSDGIAIFRTSTGYWYFDYNLDGVYDKSFRYGGSTDRIIAGNWDGDGDDEIAIFRPSTGYWYFDYNLDGVYDKSFRYGGSTDQIVVGDWDGDHADENGIFRPSTHYWYLDYNADGVWDVSVYLGSVGDIPVIGDWNGAGYSHVGVFRPSTGYWYLSSGEVGTITFHFGSNGDIPNIGVWKRENI
jgi:hypothetical protein